MLRCACACARAPVCVMAGCIQNNKNCCSLFDSCLSKRAPLRPRTKNPKTAESHHARVFLPVCACIPDSDSLLCVVTHATYIQEAEHCMWQWDWNTPRRIPMPPKHTNVFGYRNTQPHGLNPQPLCRVFHDGAGGKNSTRGAGVGGHPVPSRPATTKHAAM